MVKYTLCPFNPLHRMPVDSLQRHIIHCMKSYPTYISCTFSALHWFPTKEKMLEHLESCPARHVSNEAPLNATEFEENFFSNDTNIDNKKLNFSEENWDLEYQK